MADDEKEFVGYHQQPGKLKFGRPGGGGSRPLSDLRDPEMIPESQGGNKPQPKGDHGHDKLVTGSVIGKRTPLIDGRMKVTGQAEYFVHLITMPAYSASTPLRPKPSPVSSQYQQGLMHQTYSVCYQLPKMSMLWLWKKSAT